MTKKAIDQFGIEVIVSDDTVVKTVNGVHYLLSTQEKAEYDAKLAAFEAGALDRAKADAKQKLNEYYNSDEVRTVAYNNHAIIIRDKALLGITLLRGRLVDNNEVTEMDWHFDDGSSDTLNLGQIKQLHKFIVNKDAELRKLKKLHSDAIDALTTVEDVKNYDITISIGGIAWV